MQNDFEPVELKPRSKNVKYIITTVVVVLLVALLAIGAALLVRAFVVVTYIVDGPSMYPTLDGGSGASADSEPANGEVLYLNKLAKIKRGDIIVFNLSQSDSDQTANNARALVKRVIAVGGDHLQIISNVVYLNGEVLQENYIYQQMRTDDLDLTVPSGYVFCMGDNRNNSDDSRRFGAVPLSSVVGRCFLIKGIGGKLRLP